jgi:hypothetical protein
MSDNSTEIQFSLVCASVKIEVISEVNELVKGE